MSADVTPETAVALDDPRVIQAVEEYLAAREAGSRPSREEFLTRHPDIGGALARCLDGLEFVQRAASGLGRSSPALADAPELSSATPLGDFRILGEVGRGGMGVVYEAEQLSLGRRVALKVLALAAALDDRQLQRFKNEAQAAAHLHHANIVPVYAVGCERGVHYYAMQFIDGQPLSAAIRELRGNDEARMTNDERKPNDEARMSKDPPGAGIVAETPLGLRHSTLDILSSLGIRHSSFFRTVAQLGVQAAEALEHAHLQGIIHRDVKPANLLLDGRGRLWVADFGLAQFHKDAGLTLTGDLLGTLRYMSPEQALGRRAWTDHRTDVYSLGATLYELLTLEPAVGGVERGEVLRRIEHEEPVPPRRVNPAVPAELETVVLKALAKEPGERYATAQELADDLKRFLEDKPIRAKRPTLWQRLKKWARRNKTVVQAAVIVLVLAVVALAISTVLIWQAYHDKNLALERETAARKKTRRTLARISDRVVEETFARKTQLTEEDKKFLRDILKDYEAFAAEKGDSAEARELRAEGLFRVGTLRQKLGELPDAEAAYRAAVDTLTKLVGDFPTKPEYGLSLAKSCNKLGDLLRQTGRPRDAEEAHTAARGILSQLVAEFPTLPEYLNALADAHNSLGLLLDATGRPKEAEDAYRAVLEIRTRLAADLPKYRQDLALTHNNLGNLLDALGRREEAEVAYRAAIGFQTQLTVESPQIAEYRQDLARSHNNLGRLLRMAGRPDEAELAYNAALQTRAQLAADFPTIPQYRQELATTYNSLVNLFRDKGRPKQAEAACRAALEIQTKLAADFPNTPDYRDSLAGSHTNLGMLLHADGRLKEAEGAHRTALEIRRKLAADLPNRPDLQADVAASLGSLANVQLSQKNFAPARQLLEEAVPHLQATLQAYPKHPMYRHFWRNNRAGLCTAHLGLGDHVAAAKTAQDLETIGYQPAKDTYLAAGFVAGCVPLAETDEKLPAEKRAELARQYADRAMELLKQALANGFRDTERMKKDPTLDALRLRDDFKKLLADLDRK